MWDITDTANDSDGVEGVCRKLPYEARQTLCDSFCLLW